MKVGIGLLVLVCTVFLSACGTLQSLSVVQVPQAVRSAPVGLSVLRAPPGVSAGAIEIPYRSVYLRQTFEGSAAAGLLFGPLGTLANTAIIERLSNELAEHSKESSFLQVNTIEDAAVAWGEKPTRIDSNTLLLRPYVILYPDNARKNIAVIGGVFVSSSNEITGDKVRNADYHYVIPSTLGFEAFGRAVNPEQLSLLKKELQNGFHQIHAELLRGLSPKQASWQVALIWSEVLRASLIGFAGFTSGDVETDASGRLVIRTNMDNWGGTVGVAMRDIPQQVWIFSKPAQYRFEAEPLERKAM